MMQIPEVNAFDSTYLNSTLQQRQYAVDRLWNDQVSLPYRFDQIKIKPNDHASANSFNLSISRLYDNFLYLVSESKMSPPVDVEYFERLNLLSDLPNDGEVNEQKMFVSPDEGEVIDHVTAVTESGVKFSVSIIKKMVPAAGGRRILVPQKYIRLCSSKIGYDVKTSEYVDNSGNRKFVDPVRLCLDNSNHVYVLDTGTGQIGADDGPAVYRYNIIGILQNDPVMNSFEFTPGRELTHYVGGMDGELTDKDRFNHPKSIMCDGENLFVADTKTTAESERVTIKKYDSRLNWSQSYNLLNIDTRPIVQEGEATPQFTDMIKYNETFLMMSGDYLVEYDSNFSFIRSVEVGSSSKDDLPDTDNKPTYIHASEVNPNVLYIVREYSIDKIYYTRLNNSDSNYIIRTYSLYLAPDTRSKWIDPKYTQANKIYPGLVKRVRAVGNRPPVTNRGNVIIFNYSKDRETELYNTYVEQNDADVIMVSAYDYEPYFWADNENDLRKSILHDVFDRQIYTLQEITINENEHVNYFVYNKTISKMLHNMQIFIECVKGSFAIRGEWRRPVVEDGVETSILMPSTFQGVHYSVQNTLFRRGYNATLDNFVHINEPFVTGVFNRALEELYKLQLELLDMSEIKWIHESNVFELGTIIAAPCPDGIATDQDRPFVDDDGVCLVPDDPTSEQDLCSMFAINSTNRGSLVDSDGNCIIYGANSRGN